MRKKQAPQSSYGVLPVAFAISLFFVYVAVRMASPQQCAPIRSSGIHHSPKSYAAATGILKTPSEARAVYWVHAAPRGKGCHTSALHSLPLGGSMSLVDSPCLAWSVAEFSFVPLMRLINNHSRGRFLLSLTTCRHKAPIQIGNPLSILLQCSSQQSCPYPLTSLNLERPNSAQNCTVIHGCFTFCPVAL